MIRASNVWKSYEGVTVLRGLSLTAPQSKITVILGRSGVGKSVLLRQIAGLETPDTGTIEIEGQNVLELQGKEREQCLRNIGMLFQSSALFDSMSIEENVAFPILHHTPSASLEQDDVRTAVHEALMKVGLEGYQKKFPSELSGGQKRRAALARLIVYAPKYLLFDEPTAGLDPLTSSHIADLIIKTHQECKGVSVVVTHDMVCALKIGDYFALHHEGQIAVAGNKEEFFSSKEPALHEFLTSALVPDTYAQLIQKS